MPFLPGGQADKLGNRYEGRWIIKNYLDLLNEKIKSLIIEPFGDEGDGIDLWITDNKNHRIVCQCKARNASKDYWTPGDLNAIKIFKIARLQIDRYSDITFCFVSAIPAPQVNDLCDNTRKSPDFNSYYTFYIKKYPEKLRLYKTICRGFGLNDEVTANLEKTYYYLQKIKIKQYTDDDNTKDELLTRISYLIEGNEEDIYSLLISFATENDNLGKKITANDLLTYLENNNHCPRKLDKDKRIIPQLKAQQKKFTKSIQDQGLIKNRLIKREESQKLLEKIKKNLPLLLLHGVSGCGKSLVLYELTQLLIREGITYFPLRLDIDIIVCNSLKKLGESFGLPDSPDMCLAAQAGEKSAVLIIDQLDAIRWTGLNGNQSLVMCKQLVREVINLNKNGKKLSVIISCRTFDYKNDNEIINWIKEQKAEEFEICGFSEELVKQVIEEKIIIDRFYQLPCFS